jgi:glyoxylase-like metal-dependent hydrolase (beta-lactamase superfamily II)
MQELAEHVYIEAAYPGVLLGAINWSNGLVLIDSPIRTDDVRAWRAGLLNLGGGVDRLLVNLDANFDRTLGTRLMDCTVVGHEKLVDVFRNRPTTLKSQNMDTGSEWELAGNLGSIRWAPPEITFSDQMEINWGAFPLRLEYHPGPATGAVWAALPMQKIIFVGDAIVADQPPFLAAADLPVWIESLKLLQSPPHADSVLVSSRSGLISSAQLRTHLSYLEKVHELVEELAAKKAHVDAVDALVPQLMKPFHPPVDRHSMYVNRLRHGLRLYYQRHYQPAAGEPLEE